MYGDDSLGVMFMPPKWQPRRWGNFLRAARSLGMAVVQDGDSEGCMSFDPMNLAHVKLAIRIAGVRPKRRVSEGLRVRLIANLPKSRSESAEEGQLAP